MADNTRPPAEIKPSPIFHKSLNRHLKKDPSVADGLRKFRSKKTKRHPEKYPGEHSLRGSLKGFMDCHLSNDSVLIFNYSGNIINLIVIVEHAQLEGKKGTALAKRLKMYKK